MFPLMSLVSVKGRRSPAHAWVERIAPAADDEDDEPYPRFSCSLFKKACNVAWLELPLELLALEEVVPPPDCRSEASLLNHEQI